jgi:hypothetical protein
MARGEGGKGDAGLRHVTERDSSAVLCRPTVNELDILDVSRSYD